MTRAIDLADERDFSLGKLLVRPSSREVVVSGASETIEPRVMQVLVALARRRGEVVSREQLIELCWSGRFVSEDALNRSMTKVRKLAGPDAFTLETIPRVGYRLLAAEPAVQSLSNESRPVEPSPAASQDASPNAPVRRRRWVRWAVGVVALLVVAVIASAIGFYHQMGRPYFAVLPFDVVGSDPRAKMLADAIHTAVMTQLRAQSYRLAPTTEAAEEGADPKRAADELDARYVVHGSVHDERDRLRIAVRIVASGGVSVWSQEFTDAADDSSATPEHIALTVSSLFNPGVRMLFDNPPHVTAAIMRIASRMRAGDDLGAYVAARETWRASPKTRIYANHYALSVGPALDLLPPQERVDALREARTALSAVMDEPEQGAPMASFWLTPPVEWSRREMLLRTGLEMPFSDASGLRRLLSTQLANSGRMVEALAVSEQALGVDRSSSSNITSHAYMLDSIGRAQEADAVIGRTARLWPGYEFVERMRFSIALARQDASAMHALLADPVSGQVLDPPADAKPMPAIARAFETRAPQDIARVEFECADPAKIARERTRFCLHALVLLDRIDTIFELAPLYFPDQRGATAAQRDTRWIQNARVLTNVRVLFRSDSSQLRADDRVIPLFERLGLIDYWRTSGTWPDFCSSEPASVCAKMRGARG